jgi:hypothetical protein
MNLVQPATEAPGGAFPGLAAAWVAALQRKILEDIMILPLFRVVPL